MNRRSFFSGSVKVVAAAAMPQSSRLSRRGPAPQSLLEIETISRDHALCHTVGKVFLDGRSVIVTRWNVREGWVEEVSRAPRFDIVRRYGRVTYEIRQ